MMNRSKQELLTLEQAHRFIARLVADGQTAYLPIFERLDRELEARAAEERLIAKACQVATQK